jgi:hypothetical protein
MTRQMRLAAALAFGAGLAMAGAALAQPQSGTTSGSAAPPADAAQPVSPSPAQSATPAIKPAAPIASDQPVYSVNPPPDSSSGIYLPAVVGGYAKSVAGCVAVGCDDGPQVSPPAGPPPSGPDQSPSPLPSAGRGPTDSH